MPRSTEPSDPPHRSNHSKKASTRRKEADHEETDAAQARAEKQRQKQQRKIQQAQQEKERELVHQGGDSDEVKKLKDQNSALIEQRDAANRKFQELQEKVSHGNKDNTDYNPEDYKRPSRLSSTSIKEIRRLLGLGDLSDETQNNRWNEIRACIRDQLRCAHIDPAKSLKKTDSKRIGRYYAAVEEYEPALKRFELSWPIEYVVWEFSSNYKGHKGRKRRRLQADADINCPSDNELRSPSHCPQLSDRQPDHNHNGEDSNETNSSEDNEDNEDDSDSTSEESNSSEGDSSDEDDDVEQHVSNATSMKRKRGECFGEV
ncbi:hypothetical protein AAF712_003204 [Marasmius tenuissimus]|uniref:Uncharacterized protein n=1 Tax=Marasmius tenuissimus TaxID=585030 RepID=A0ABR3A6C9_9AGAR